MKFKACSHCRGTRYVFLSWFDRMLKEQEIRMVDILPDILKIIPPQYFVYCHCNPRIVLLNRRFTACDECDGTTWKFSEFAEHNDYFQKRISKVYWQKIVHLPSSYFERCSCGHKPNPHEEKQLLEFLLGLMSDSAFH